MNVHAYTDSTTGATYLVHYICLGNETDGFHASIHYIADINNNIVLSSEILFAAQRELEESLNLTQPSLYV